MLTEESGVTAGGGLITGAELESMKRPENGATIGSGLVGSVGEGTGEGLMFVKGRCIWWL